MSLVLLVLLVPLMRLMRASLHRQAAWPQQAATLKIFACGRLSDQTVEFPPAGTRTFSVALLQTRRLSSRSRRLTLNSDRSGKTFRICGGAVIRRVGRYPTIPNMKAWLIQRILVT